MKTTSTRNSPHGLILCLLGIMTFIVFLCSPSYWVTSAKADAAKPAEPTIALLLPLSGSLADWGTAMRLGAEMALAESGAKARLIVEDTQFQSTVALAAYEKLLHTDHPDAVIVFGSGVSTALAPHLERDQLLTISISTSDEVQRDKRFVFRHMVSTSTVTDALIPEVLRLGLTKIAAIATTQDGMLAFQRAFMERVKEKGLLAADVPPTERDFNAIVTKIIASGADSVYSTLLPPQGSIFAKQARHLGFKGQIFAATQVNSQAELTAGGEAFENLFFTADGDASLANFEAQFLNRYKTRPDSFAGNAYDSVNLLISALKSEEPIGTLESLSKYEGALGTYSALPNHTFGIPAHLRQIVSGKSVVLH